MIRRRNYYFFALQLSGKMFILWTHLITIIFPQPSMLQR